MRPTVRTVLSAAALEAAAQHVAAARSYEFQAGMWADEASAAGHDVFCSLVGDARMSWLSAAVSLMTAVRERGAR